MKFDGTATQGQPEFGPLVQVFPNPARDFVNLGFSRHTERANVVMVDITGNVVLQTWYAPAEGPTMQTLEFNHLSAGIYILSISAGERTERVRLVVQ